MQVDVLCYPGLHAYGRADVVVFHCEQLGLGLDTLVFWRGTSCSGTSWELEKMAFQSVGKRSCELPWVQNLQVRLPFTPSAPSLDFKTKSVSFRSNVLHAAPHVTILAGIAAHVQSDASSQPSYRSLVVLGSAGLLCSCQVRHFRPS